ncbi:hypothetical protein [Halococcus agarilyticus]|uniref:hypothetical protein n=1 Tax=Halococcus agarilyticus TaxID=1232219 RepID=UPI0006780631|nr:hypothetical protein [Halococcus agarilyticus]
MTADANGGERNETDATAAVTPADGSGDADHDVVTHPDVPDWDDEYVDRVSDRLQFNYDLERDFRTRGERFTLYGTLHVESHKQFLHSALSYGHHESGEHLFVRRVDRTGVAELERLVDLGHALADEWVEPNEEHFSTDFTFAVAADTLDDDTRSFVEGFKDRTLLKYGYHGHYEINLVIVEPDRETLAASRNADVADAFRLWGDDTDRSGLLGRIVARVRR